MISGVVKEEEQPGSPVLLLITGWMVMTFTRQSTLKEKHMGRRIHSDLEMLSRMDVGDLAHIWVWSSNEKTRLKIQIWRSYIC